MTTISDLTALLVQSGWPRLEPPQGNDTITQPLPKGPWWCCDPDQHCITLHTNNNAVGITVGYDQPSGQLLDTTVWTDLYQDDNNPDAPAELLSLAVWPPGLPQQTLDLILRLSEQQLQAISSLVANSQ